MVADFRDTPPQMADLVLLLLESTTEVSDMEDASESDAADVAGWLESV